MIQILINSYRIFISITDNQRKQNYNILHKKKSKAIYREKGAKKLNFATTKIVWNCIDNEMIKEKIILASQLTERD